MLPQLKPAPAGPERAATGLDVALRRVLARYLSPITVDAVLRRIYAEERLDPLCLTQTELERVFQSGLFLGLRMFCKKDRLSSAMLDLADLLEKIPSPGEA